MAVYFKFKSAGEQAFDSVSLEGKSPFISVSELKSQIAGRKKIDKSNGLLLTNAQTGEEYKDDAHLIQKNTSVIVQVVPLLSGQKIALSSKNPHQQRALQNQKIVNEGSDLNVLKSDLSGRRDTDDFGPELFSNDFNSKASNDNFEDSKINALIHQSRDAIPTTGPKATRQNRRMGESKAPPPTYICHRCNQPGHYIYDCPTNGDPAFNHPKPHTQHGVPMKFLKVGQDGLKEYKPVEQDFHKLISVSGLTEQIVKKEVVPPELACPICHKMYNNAVLIPCCTESACDECIRTALIEKTNFTCPLCKHPMTPDQLLPNKGLRRSVETYKSAPNKVNLNKEETKEKAADVDLPDYLFTEEPAQPKRSTSPEPADSVESNQQQRSRSNQNNSYQNQNPSYQNQNPSIKIKTPLTKTKTPPIKIKTPLIKIKTPLTKTKILLIKITPIKTKITLIKTILTQIRMLTKTLTKTIHSNTRIIIAATMINALPIPHKTFPSTILAPNDRQITTQMMFMITTNRG